MPRAPGDSTMRFSNRVKNYIAYRPHYPGEILECLKSDCGLNAESTVADIGSGTGMLAELLLANGNRVFGVEPNLEMREAGERLLKSQPRFTSIAGTAEETTLASLISLPRARRFIGLIASDAARNSGAFSGPTAGWCWSGMAGERRAVLF